MVEMNMDRINRWKCLLCGSKLKKIIDLKDSKDMVIGYSLHCCNCGHLDNFALNMKAIDTMTGYEGKANDRVISCGVSIHNIDACAFKECPFRKKENKFEENEKRKKKELREKYIQLQKENEESARLRQIALKNKNKENKEIKENPFCGYENTKPKQQIVIDDHSAYNKKQILVKEYEAKKLQREIEEKAKKEHDEEEMKKIKKQ